MRRNNYSVRGRKWMMGILSTIMFLCLFVMGSENDYFPIPNAIGAVVLLLCSYKIKDLMGK